MNVGTLGADNLTKHTVLGHVEGVHFKPVVAAVFEYHAVLAGLFRKVDEVPALFEVHGRGHFDGGVLAILHSELGYGEVVIPVGCYIYDVDVVALAEFLVAFGT